MNPFANRKISDKGELATQVREALADNLEVTDYIESTPFVDIASLDDVEHESEFKLSQLVDDNFPFDDSQLAAVTGMMSQPYACLTGAAGTGKTTVTKKLVDSLLKSTSLIKAVDMETYWKSNAATDSDDDYEIVKRWVPSVAMVGFTGRSTQMIKKNFPQDWHGNIMTIHRLLGFMPEWYDHVDESNKLSRKMRFVPTYNRDLKMPWDIILIDEAGMVGLDLWNQLLDAMKPTCRVYMIGDINQLPPVHGRSIFGFAMAKWPSWELTQIHRQAGQDNPIVDNAWRVLRGVKPVSQGNFQMVEVQGDHNKVSRLLKAMLMDLRKRNIYDPYRDTVIVPTNGELGSRGESLGQLPLNRELAGMINPESAHPRYLIDGGREQKLFAVGDKVMATRNDHEIGITNGMTGIITDISANGDYAGDSMRFGMLAEVNKYFATDQIEDTFEETDLESIMDRMSELSDRREKAKEARERGPASHSVTVNFGTDEHPMIVVFGSLAEVASLMIAYAVTCHKMQGGEAPVVIIVCHDAHRAMMYREWIYTALTRASQMAILVYTKDALRVGLNKQRISGTSLREKVAAFIALMPKDKDDPMNAKIRLPDHLKIDESFVPNLPSVAAPQNVAAVTQKLGAALGLKPIAAPAPSHSTVHIHVHVQEKPVEPVIPEGSYSEVSEAPKLTRESMLEAALARLDQAEKLKALPAPVKLVSQWGAAHQAVHLGRVKLMSSRLLPHYPTPVEPASTKVAVKLGFNPFAKRG